MPVKSLKPIAILTGVLLMTQLALFAQSDSGRGRHKEFYVVPAPGEVTIDGSLDDWDLSAQIEMFVIEATRSTQSAKIAAMYNDEAFYLSGVVNDPTPMMNRHNPAVNAERAWDADAVQFRLTIDPAAGYPVRESSFDYRRKGGRNAPAPPEDTRDDIVHMLLWHYTDEGTHHLQMQKGMSYRTPDPSWQPDGLVPPDKYEGFFREHDDQLGYTFEYRIPWSTLGAEKPLEGGDVVAGTVNVFWSRPDGLAHIRISGAAYDIMGEPGFPFQKTDSWGKVIFSKTGNVSRDLVTAGLPPERTLPLEFSYDLPDDGIATIQLFKPDGTAARILVPHENRLGGRNTERWDGLDDGGDLLPAGEYRWRGVFAKAPVKAEYRFSVHNSGNPPYTTVDGKGGWGGDHGEPMDVAALSDGMLLLWRVAEYGSGTIRVDNDGRKQWGTQAGGRHIATDGTYYYIGGIHAWHGGGGIGVFEVESARPAQLANGSGSLLYPEGGNDETNHESGIAWHNGTLYVSFEARDLIAAYNTETGDLLGTFEVPAPERLAVTPEGALLVVSEGKVMSVQVSGFSVQDGEAKPDTRDLTPETLIADHLDDPRGIAVGPDGTIYVANAGDLQSVSVFDKAGRYLRGIGKPGGRPAVGTYDPSGMFAPGGVALDGEGRLWVAETRDSPKRISVWDTKTGENLSEFFGGSGYFSYGHIDEKRPNEILAHNVLWAIDWDTYTTRPISTIWRKTEPNMMGGPGAAAYQHVPKLVTAANGTQYLYGNRGGASILMRREGDIFKPFAALLDTRRGTGISLVKETNDQWKGNSRFPPVLLWQDANDDQIVQLDELTQLEDGYSKERFAWLEPDLTLRVSNGKIWRPVGIQQNGRVVYDPAAAEPAVAAATSGYMALTDDGAILTLHHNDGPSLVKHLPNGDTPWNYPDLIAWRQTLNMPLTGPGRLWGMTGLMGVAGDYFAHQAYWGCNQLFRTDGQYINALLNDRRSVGRGPYAGQSEGQGGSFVKLTIDGKERRFIIGGSNDVRIWEVMGLDALRDIPGGTYTHTEEAVAQARAAKTAYEASLVGNPEPRIVPGGKAALADAPSSSIEIEGDRAVAVRLAYDAENLYLRYDVETPHELVNATPDSRIIFRGGNLIDIQLAADPDAAADRKTPAPGDQRLLISRRDRKAIAVHFQPKVAGFEGEPTVLSSPTGKESFDRIDEVEVGLEYERTDNGFRATVTMPQSLLGLDLAARDVLRLDLGYIFGNAEGTRANARAYLFNHSFSANVVDDIPHESRLEPAEWGEAEVE